MDDTIKVTATVTVTLSPEQQDAYRAATGAGLVGMEVAARLRPNWLKRSTSSRGSASTRRFPSQHRAPNWSLTPSLAEGFALAVPQRIPRGKQVHRQADEAG